MDYYSVLGISQDASQDDIKKAYRRLAHKFHPDKGGDEKKFKEINEAYQVLGNDQKRKQYDQFGQSFDSQDGPGFDFSQGFGQGQGFGFESGFDPGDISDLFSDIFGFGRSRTRKDINKGEDIEIGLEIDLKDTLKSFKKSIYLDRFDSCQRCQGMGNEPGTKIKECFSCRGKGQVQQIKKSFLGTITHYVICPECRGEGKIPEKPCNVCKGHGRIENDEQVEIAIPAGIDTGQILKVAGKGDAGYRGGQAGDLFIRIIVQHHPLFERKGDNLYLSLPISFSQASLGCQIEVPTLENKDIILKVPAGTNSGKVFRIRSKGIPHFSGIGRGDLYVKLDIETPAKLNKKQKELLEKLLEQGL